MTNQESTSPIYCYLDGFRHYVDFRGRTRVWRPIPEDTPAYTATGEPWFRDQKAK